jgi:tryptophanyl-tRNA synthetase
MAPRPLFPAEGAIIITIMNRKRILTGDTPTGKLHLGHYVGTLENRVRLQGEYETFVVLADVHALTTLSKDPRVVREHVLEVAKDNLAAGLDPKETTIFVESQVPAIYELAAIFSMYVSHARALRNPTVKDEIKMKGLGEGYSLGFINYPILQVADILSLKAHLVPVGEDQVPHLEQTREVARVFNRFQKGLFPIPKPLVGSVGRLVGTDGGAKMSKSLGNVIYLSDSEKIVREKVKNMYTDPSRVHPTDPGQVKDNPLFIYLDSFSADKRKIAEFKERYRQGKVGDVEVKEYLAGALNDFLGPIRARRKRFEKSADLKKILEEGRRRVTPIVEETLTRVKNAIGFTY